MDRHLARLFGGTEEGIGLLRFDDALAEFDPERQVHRQTFIAIDRFTGGVVPGALYSVEAVWSKAFVGRIHFRPERLASWMQALLLYALRDAVEGDLLLGWGQARGYGQLHLRPAKLNADTAEAAELLAWLQAQAEAAEREQIA